MTIKQDKYAGKSIDINDFEQNLERVLNESKGAPIAVLKDGSPLYYCVPADTYAGMLEAIEAIETVETEKMSVEIRLLGLEVFGNEERFKSWMKKPALALGGETPEAIMITDEGINKVSDLLGRINHGLIM